MTIQFSEAENALGACDPSGWHEQMHNPSGICKRMSMFFIGQGMLERVKWMSANCEGSWTDATGEAAMADAASNGHLEVVQYLHEHFNRPATNAVVVAAAASGHLNVVRYLHENQSERCSTDVIKVALENGHAAVVEFMLQHNAFQDPHRDTERTHVVDAEHAPCSASSCVGLSESNSSAPIQPRERLRLTVVTTMNQASKSEVSNEEDQADVCPICCDGLSDPFTTACRHAFCTVCILQWLENNNDCPVCRQTIDLLSPAEATGRQMSEAVPFDLSIFDNEGDTGVPSPSTEAVGGIPHRSRVDSESPRYFSSVEVQEEIARLTAAHRTAALLTSTRARMWEDTESHSRTSSFSYLEIDELYGWPSTSDDGGFNENAHYRWPSSESLRRSRALYEDVSTYDEHARHPWPRPRGENSGYYNEHARHRWPSFDEIRPNRNGRASSTTNEFQPDEAAHELQNFHSNDTEVADVCSICYEVPEDRAWTLCRHSFCSSCLNAWRKIGDTCPVCRDPLV
ncbi:unnamed protein product [Phytophthora fragariaefolia]|uniref:Unnamed protein product n=1 Tax=Phytophthora fragariaefolia TaxID=1490495 RepID=A0A9W6U1V1_9STRA|nr:unnamed protein product [Phytophthora fragariaefolia]